MGSCGISAGKLVLIGFEGEKASLFLQGSTLGRLSLDDEPMALVSGQEDRSGEQRCPISVLENLETSRRYRDLSRQYQQLIGPIF